MKKEKQEGKIYIFPNSKIYTEYNLNMKQKILCFIVGFLVGTVTGYIFYSNIIVGTIAGVICGFSYIPIRRRQNIDTQIKKLKIQFKDLLENISTSIGAGKNVVDSFRTAYYDLKNQYSESADMVKEVQNIVTGIDNNINIEELLMDLADRSGVEDIVIFANVFETCYRKGGNIKEVVKSTYQIINDKMEIDMEIETMITSGKTEQKMMLIMPIIFVFILDTMGGAISGRGTAVSMVSTTVAIVFFALAYFVGKKIMDIKM